MRYLLETYQSGRLISRLSSYINILKIKRGNMEFCCEVFDNHFNEGFLKEERYFISDEEDAPSEKRHFFAEISAYNEVESKIIKMPFNYCPFCGEKLGE
jgi:hypothetical protein